LDDRDVLLPLGELDVEARETGQREREQRARDHDLDQTDSRARAASPVMPAGAHRFPTRTSPARVMRMVFVYILPPLSTPIRRLSVSVESPVGITSRTRRLGDRESRVNSPAVKLRVRYLNVVSARSATEKVRDVSLMSSR